MIYTTSLLTEGENQEAEYDVPEDVVEFSFEDLEDGSEFEYIIE